MRFAFYCGVLLVAAAGVVFGLDWMSAPMPPMPDVKNVVFVPPPPPPPPRVAQPAPVSPANAATPASTPAAPPVSTAPARAPVGAAQTRPPEVAPVPPPVAAAAPPPKCDVDACARAYRSFQESDCTYNPSFGPRRLCTKGDPAKYAREHAEPPVAPASAELPSSIVAPEPGTSAASDTGAAAEAPAAPAAPRCNVAVCAAAYPRSFRESDCTYNPSSGSRKLCEK